MSRAWLFERLAQWGDAAAVVWADKALSYAELLRRVDDWKATLARERLGPGAVLVIEANFSPNACALLLACLDLGLVAVPVVPAMRAHKDEFAAIAEAQATVALDEQDQASWQHHPRPVTNGLTQKLRSRGHAGLVIFSSGSSGKPKAVLHDFELLLGKFEKARAKKTVLTFLLFDHIGGIDTLLNTLTSGGTVVTTPSRDADVVCGLIAKHQVHTLPTSPTFLNLLLISQAWQRADLSSLQVIAYGTEPMPESTLKRLGEALPHVKLVQTYGMSELGVLRSKPKGDGSLWMKFSHEGFETKVVDGVLWVKAATAMLGYLNAPDLFDADGWLNTQDAVEVDGEHLRILGRVTDLINVGGQKVYPAEVEAVLLECPNVRDVAVYGEKSPLTGAFVAARVNLLESEALDVFKRRLRAFCKDKLAPYKVPVRIELTDEQQFGARMKKLRKVSPA